VAGNGLTLKDIQSILDIIKSAEDIQDFSLKFEGTEIHISRSGGGFVPTTAARAPLEAAPPPVAAAPAQAPMPAAKGSAAGGAKEYGPNATLIKSSMVGVFYRAPAPGEAPFVEVGQKVEADQVLCILEVMKLMNSIASPINGTVTHILVENGDPVEFGQVIMVIEGVA
jgi:acetyl-CoA carboxylase biotin carboxyl carrier protein